jgi:hypothetical protein
MKYFQLRRRISLFRGEVKEECTKLINKLFNDTVDLPQKISQIVDNQLLSYNYIFPSVSVSFIHCSFTGANLTNVQTASSGVSGTRGRPYRNDRIISVVRTLYFSGSTALGTASFASQFAQLFPTFETLDGRKTKVPIAMIALVGTAVSVQINLWRSIYFIVSFMPVYMNGALVNAGLWSSRPMYSLTYTWDTPIHLRTSRRSTLQPSIA